MGVVVENLEPGVNYTWRIAIDTPAGRIVSRPRRARRMSARPISSTPIRPAVDGAPTNARRRSLLTLRVLPRREHGVRSVLGRRSGYQP